MDNLVPILREVFNKVPAVKTDRELLKNMVIGYTITAPEEKTNFDELLLTGFIDALFNVSDISVLKAGSVGIANIVSKKIGCDREKIVHSINLWYQVIKNADDELLPETGEVEQKAAKEPENPIDEKVVRVEEPKKEAEKTQSVTPQSAAEPKTQEPKQPKLEKASQPETQPVTPEAAKTEEAKTGLSGDAKLGIICFLVFILFLCIKLNTGRSLDRAFFGTTFFGDKPKKTKVVKTEPAKRNTERVDLSFLDENTKPEPAPEPKPAPQAQPESPKAPEQPKAPAVQPAPESKPQPPVQSAPKSASQKKAAKQRAKSTPKVKKVPVQMPAVQQQPAHTPAPVQTGPDDAELARQRREENLRRINSAQ